MTKDELREFYEEHGIYSLTDSDLETILELTRRREKKKKNKHVPLENDTD